MSSSLHFLFIFPLLFDCLVFVCYFPVGFEYYFVFFVSWLCFVRFQTEKSNNLDKGHIAAYLTPPLENKIIIYNLNSIAKFTGGSDFRCVRCSEIVRVARGDRQP